MYSAIDILFLILKATTKLSTTVAPRYNYKYMTPVCGLKYRRRPFSVRVNTKHGRQKHLKIASSFPLRFSRHGPWYVSRIFIHSSSNVDNNVQYHSCRIIPSTGVTGRFTSLVYLDPKLSVPSKYDDTLGSFERINCLALAMTGFR